MTSAAGTDAPARRGFGLRLRVTAAFMIGSLVLAAILTAVTYSVAQRYLVEQRERSLRRQAFLDARVVRDQIQAGHGVASTLDALDRARGSEVLVARDGRWYSTTTTLDARDVPPSLRQLVAASAPGQQRVRASGPVFVVGLPLPSVDAGYYELFRLTELERTLGVIRNALVAGAALAITLAGLLGYWLSRRALRPVTTFAVAAEQVSEGDLQVRLPDTNDPDLGSLTRSFNRMVDSVQDRIDRETRFVADASHELRSPLTTLATAVQVLGARRDELPARAGQAFDLLAAEVARVQRLVEDLLELGRADAGNEELDLAPVDVGELVEQAIGPERVRRATIAVEPTLRTHPVLLDKWRLQRMMTNLADNADAYGGGLRAVTVRAYDGTLRIEVDDAGPGVPVAERRAIFDRFYRGAAAGSRASGSGSGLGLALVAQHTGMHGGRIWVEDVPSGPGARFVVELPWRAP